MISMTSPASRPWAKYSADEQAACLRWAEQPGRHVLTLDHPDYPPLLREIAEPPPVLFVRGNVDVLTLPQIAIVGSRHPSADGCINARLFSAGLSAAGYVITSGMAIGIDGEAHKGALGRDGITVAVLGSGLDQIHPPTHKRLADKIARRGAVISEFMPNEPAYQSNFPQRNRIISGLAHGVLVVEAAERSGSLITARLAGEQGREVFAMPGSIHNPVARGCHKLIRQGVKLVDSVADILEEFPALLHWEQERVAATQEKQKLPKASKAVLAHIAYDPVSIDTLVQRTGCELPALYTHLMKLELAGLIVNRSDGYVLSPP
jgi:DNA processing protein